MRGMGQIAWASPLLQDPESPQERVRDGRFRLSDHVVHQSIQLDIGKTAPRCSCVAAAAEFEGNFADVNDVLGAERDVDGSLGRLDEHDGHFNTSDGSELADETGGVIICATRLLHHLGGYVGCSKPPVSQHLESLEHGCMEVNLVQCSMFENGLCDPSDIRASANALCCIRKAAFISTRISSSGSLRGQTLYRASIHDRLLAWRDH